MRENSCKAMHLGKMHHLQMRHDFNQVPSKKLECCPVNERYMVMAARKDANHTAVKENSDEKTEVSLGHAWTWTLPASPDISFFLN